jgi:hypothetical protein
LALASDVATQDSIGQWEQILVEVSDDEDEEIEVEKMLVATCED